MIDIIVIISIIISLPLGLRGLFLCHINRHNLKGVLGFRISVNTLIILFFGILFLFSLLTYVNYYRGFVVFHLNYNFGNIISDVFSYFSSAFLEEFIFRALLFVSLINIIKNKFLLVFITSILFSVFHMPNNLFYFLSYFIGGVMYGYSYLKFQNFPTPVGLHFSWNFIQGGIFGYPVSGNESEGILSLTITPDILFNGGSQGPEGSVLGIIVRLFIILLVFVLPNYQRNKNFLKVKGL